MNMKYERIYNFGNIITGKTPKTLIDEYWNGPYPFITPTDIPSYDTKTLFTTERTISNLGMQKQKNTLLPIGTICVSCIATIGKVCQVDKPSISNQQINSIIPNEKFDSNYLYYLFRYNLPYFECIAGGTGSGTPIINKGKFSGLQLEIFENKDIQTKIGKILSNYDELIENNNQRIKILENTAQELYKEWFVRFRYPGYKKDKFENGLPEGWKIDTIGNCCSIKIGGDAPKNFSISKDDIYKYPIYSNGVTDYGLYGFSNLYTIASSAITISARGTIGYVCLRYPFFTPIVRLITLIPYRDYNALYFYEGIKYIDLGGNGTSQQQITKPMISKRKIILPNKFLMEKFVTLVNPMFEKIKSLQDINFLLKKQRDALLPRLMSGKLSVEGKEIL